tara:strand:- start:7142 stop:7552 length:411 start_codon:yes stop_codon:yes gene_type:complete
MYQSSEIAEKTNDNSASSTQFNFDIDVNYFSLDVDDDDIRDTLFRQQILSFFKMEEYNETVIDIKIDYLKPIIESNESLKKLSIKFSNLMLQEKFDIGVVMFFAYDYFHQTFLLLKDFLLENKINKDIYNNLIKKL